MSEDAGVDAAKYIHTLYGRAALDVLIVEEVSTRADGISTYVMLVSCCMHAAGELLYTVSCSIRAAGKLFYTSC